MIMLVLGSLSPRRRELMRLITPDFDVDAPDCGEDIPFGTAPREAVEILALRKARAVLDHRGADICIGADTVVAVDGVILGKPCDEAHAAQMLGLLSGKTHCVYTGVAIVNNKKQAVFSCATHVHFRALSPDEIAAYIATGEPMDKAGSYGIQGRGALFISGIEGDYYNVMGLPVCMLNQRLIEFMRREL
ncbi:MAG: Maf family protein [Oscillospiraceae bacterium]|nr:Maf family protein [Oscillospiraceae bacterium]